MCKVIINADDLGMSEAFNYGVLKSLREGVASSTTLMVNMPGAGHAVRLVKEIPGVFIGLHANFVLGKPCADPGLIPSMVDQNGFFHRSSDYRTGKRQFQYQEAKTELIAQMERFKELLGYYPSHIEGHAAGNEATAKAFYDVALEYGVHTSPGIFHFEGEKPIDGYLETTSPFSPQFMMSYIKNGLTVENVLNDDIGILRQDKNKVVELHFHPGYLDQFILDHSSMTLVRCRDLDTLCDKRVSEWFDRNHIQLISFGDLRQYEGKGD
jgi:predicted glycoside hydrolase/deacetylase ChbG (UPF0249 family)